MQIIYNGDLAVLRADTQRIWAQGLTAHGTWSEPEEFFQENPSQEGAYGQAVRHFKPAHGAVLIAASKDDLFTLEDRYRRYNNLNQ